MIDKDDAELVRKSFRSILTAADPTEVRVRLVEDGWYELVESYEPEGVGFLFEEQGRSLAASGALDLVVARAADFPLQELDAFVHPRERRLDEMRLELDGILLVGPVPGRLVVPEGRGAVAVDPRVAEIGPITGFDPTLGLRSICLPETTITDPWSEVAPAARRALSHELIGITEVMLDLSVSQISERQQYGRPIGSFQAVQHRMADVAVALDAARAATAASWRIPGQADPLACLAAKALAGRAALMAARHCQQVCGAIGFTIEHRLPRYVRRAHVLDSLYGSTDLLQRAIGREQLIAGATIRLSPSWETSDA
jgi:hypothetical protein